MYECGSYRGVLIAALIPLLASVSLRLHQAAKAWQQRALDREIEQYRQYQQKLAQHMYVLLDAWEFDHPDRRCPATVDELDEYTVGRHAQDHRKLQCERMSWRGPTYLLVEEGDGQWGAFDPGEIRPRSHLLEEDKLKRNTWPDLGTIRKRGWYTFEAYPAWARQHPGKACPKSLDELNVYIGVNDSRDFWGHPIGMQCDPTSPTGLAQILVFSAGADGKFGTDDDLPRQH